MNEQLFEIQPLLRNLIRIGTLSAVNLDGGLCRVDTGKNTTGWLRWLNARAGKTRAWNAPSVGEQVLVLCLGGELDTGFVLPGIFSDDNLAPSASADALHWSFPDGAVIEYEPETAALMATGIQTATIKAAVKILLDSPEVECTTLLKTAQLEVTKGGTMKDSVTHTGGNLSSNGKVLHLHIDPGDSGGKTGHQYDNCKIYRHEPRTHSTLTDLDHFRQSVRDILLPPVGTMLMRRQCGSLLSALIDQLQNEALRLHIMSACYQAILQWEPRIKLTAISFESNINGAMVVELSGNRTDSAQAGMVHLSGR